MPSSAKPNKAGLKIIQNEKIIFKAQEVFVLFVSIQ